MGADTEKLLEALTNRIGKIETNYEKAVDALKEFESKNFKYMGLSEASKEADELKDLREEELKLNENLEKVEKEKEDVENDIKDLANEEYEKAVKKITECEEKLKKNQEKIERTDKKIEELTKELEELETKDEPDMADYMTTTLATLNFLKQAKEGYVLNVEDIQKDLDSANSRKKDIEDKYKDLLDLKEPEVSKEESKKEEPAKEDGNKDTPEENGKEEKNNNGKAKGTPVYGGIPNVPEESPEDKEIKDLKKSIESVKAGKGSIEDRDKVAKLLSDPANYDKFGFKNSLFGNDAKNLLAFLSQDMLKNIAGNLKIKKYKDELGKEKSIDALGVEFEQPDSKNKNILGTTSLTNMKNVKKLADGEVDLAAIKHMKKVVNSIDPETLDEDAKKIYDGYVKNLKQYDEFMSAAKGYNEWSKEHEKDNRIVAFFKSRFGSKRQALNKGQEEVEAPVSIPKPESKFDKDMEDLKQPSEETINFDVDFNIPKEEKVTTKSGPKAPGE